MVSDITEQYAAAKALREAEETYRTIFENAVEGLFQTLPNGRVLKANAAMAEILGYPSADALVMHIRDVSTQLYIDESDRKSLLALLERSGRVDRFQVRVQKRDGRQIWCEISARAIWDDQGSIRLIEGLLADVTESKAREMDLKRRATRDDLTGLFNRFYFSELFSGALASAVRNKSKLGILYIDLDNFKRINDSYGHQAGDRVLREVAERFRARLREVDILGRIGGDEFCVVLTDIAHSDDVKIVALELLRTLKEPMTSIIPQRVVNASIGAAVYPDNGSTVDELMHRADDAMYYAKEEERQEAMMWADIHNSKGSRRTT